MFLVNVRQCFSLLRALLCLAVGVSIDSIAVQYLRLKSSDDTITGIIADPLINPLIPLSLSARCLEQITIRPGQLCDGQALSISIESPTVGSVWLSLLPALSIVESFWSKLLLIGQEDPSEQ